MQLLSFFYNWKLPAYNSASVVTDLFGVMFIRLKFLNLRLELCLLAIEASLLIAAYSGQVQLST